MTYKRRNYKFEKHLQALAAANMLYHARLHLARTDIPATLSVCDAEMLLFHCECAIRLENSQN